MFLICFFNVEKHKQNRFA